jgi:hypothetical protein
MDQTRAAPRRPIGNVRDLDPLPLSDLKLEIVKDLTPLIIAAIVTKIEEIHVLGILSSCEEGCSVV